MNAFVPSSESVHTLSRLQVNLTYFIDIRAEYRFRFCNQFVYAEFSNAVNTTTTELRKDFEIFDSGHTCQRCSTDAHSLVFVYIV